MPESTVPNAPADALRAFKQEALKVLAQMGTTAELYTGDVSDYARMAGLPSDIRSNGTGYTLPDVPETTTGPLGLPRDQFTQAALDESDTKLLDRAKADVYTVIRRAAQRGHVPTDAAVEALQALGLAVPVTQSHVSAYVTGLGNVEFTVPGTITKDEVKERLMPLASDPRRDAILSAFPDASQLDDLVRDVWIAEILNWPAKHNG